MADLMLNVIPGHDRDRVVVIGRLDRHTADSFRDQLTAIVNGEHGPPLLVIDLHCCTTIDNDGLRSLAQARENAAAVGRELRLERVPPLIGYAASRFSSAPPLS